MVKIFNAQFKENTEALSDIRSEINRTHRELQALRETVQKEKDILTNDLEMFKSEIENKKSILSNEVDVLEKRKLNAQIPLDEIKSQLDLREKSLNEQEKELTLKIADVSNIQIESEKKIEYAENMADELHEKLSKADEITRNSLIREEIVRKKERELLLKIETFNLSQQNQDKEIEQRERKIREDLAFIEAKERNLKERELSLVDEQARVNSQRMSLRATLQEIDKKKNVT